MTAHQELATVIGDVVRSRELPDQRRLLEDLAAALDWLAGIVPASQPLRPSVGDEFQGAYASLSQALLATLLLRLRLQERIDVRFGVGWGTVTVLDPSRVPAGQSGTAWWSAREAIEHVGRVDAGAKGWPEGLRTWFAGGDEALRGVVNAHLVCRDHILWRMDAIDARIALAMFLGTNQVEMERELGIKQPTISRRQRRRGPSALYRAQESLRAMATAVAT
ncbi:MAG TPA: SatD family protein [Thermoanaerobaculia bacterium]|jgi:hypothetical protein|nr:SatD family protein [Thermoanaerobaculia bacterium]